MMRSWRRPAAAQEIEEDIEIEPNTHELAFQRAKHDRAGGVAHKNRGQSR